MERGCGMRTKSGKRVSFDPRAGNVYRVLFDGVPVPGRDGLLTRKQILDGIYEVLAQGHSIAVGRGSSKKQNEKTSHPSKYRAKHR